jgi:proteasome activator subunit 4
VSYGDCTELTRSPEIFELREMNDNPEMQGIAGRLLAWITSITPSFELVDPLMQQLISILQDSTVS